MLGYSQKILELVEKGDQDQLGVRFAKFCIAHNLSVVTVAKQLGVTRMTLYRWFSGSNINKAHRDSIRLYMRKFSS